ncbi:MAG: sigma-54-dependent Fis family transcriptional regulator [Emcibacteraceae bacterium]|nr:sigma-54-dependent Fis family transcriptional regulator [Emcibacteraceae bacterium]
MKSVDILLIEDSFSLALTYMEYLKPTGHEVYHCSSGAEVLSMLKNVTPSLILLDLKLPDMSGMEILDFINENNISTNVIVITAHGSIEVAVEAMQKGAFDFILKPFNAGRLTTTVRNALDNNELKKIVEKFEETVPKSGLNHFVGSSYPMKAVYQIIKSASTSDASVFITGESGSGKEICAEALHSQSKRRNKPFVAINCGSIPRELLESEIFGHKKGAFTGAISNRDGAALSADGGTLFLDEICELDIDLQIKLLRFIQTKTFRKVGGDKDITVDIRFVCASNKDPHEQVNLGKFREDLYYRLFVIPIHMPPLKDREEDIIELAEHFLNKYTLQEQKRFNQFDESVLKLFSDYSWPGNVRELQNIIQQIVVLSDGEVVTMNMLPEILMTNNKALPSRPAKSNFMRNSISSNNNAVTVQGQNNDEIMPLWVVEKDAMEKTIKQCDGNVVKAAAFLEVSPSTIYRKMRGWGVEL